MQQDYKAFIDRVIDHYEGGYGWNPKDKGGPTKYGITCYDLAEHRGEKMDSMAKWAPLVKEMKREEAEAIYQKKYAVGTHFDALPAGVDCCVLDYAINSGVGRANNVLKAVTGGQAIANAEQVVNAICDERLRFMHSIRGGSDWTEFGHGWQARVDDLRHYCTALVHNVPADGPPTIPAAPKVAHPDPNTTEHVKRTVVVAAGTAGATHASGQSHTVTVIVGLVALVGASYILYRNRQKIAALNLKPLI